MFYWSKKQKCIVTPCIFGILGGRQVLLYLHPIRRLAVIPFLVILGCWSVMSFEFDRAKFLEWTSTVFVNRLANKSNNFSS